MDVLSVLAGVLLALVSLWILPPIAQLVVPPYAKVTSTVVTTVLTSTFITHTEITTFTTQTITTHFNIVRTTITNTVLLVPSQALKLLNNYPSGYYNGLLLQQYKTVSIGEFIDDIVHNNNLALITPSGIELLTYEGKVLRSIKGDYISVSPYFANSFIATTLLGKVFIISKEGVTELKVVDKDYVGVVASNKGDVVLGASKVGYFKVQADKLKLKWSKNIKWIVSIDTSDIYISIVTNKVTSDGENALYIYTRLGRFVTKIHGKFYVTKVCKDYIIASGPSGTILLKKSKTLWTKPFEGYRAAFSPNCKYVAILSRATGSIKVFDLRGNLRLMIRIPGASAIAWGPYLYVGTSNGDIYLFKVLEVEPTVGPFVGKVTTLYFTTTSTITNTEWYTVTAWTTRTMTFTWWVTKHATITKTTTTWKVLTSTLTRYIYTTRTVTRVISNEVTTYLFTQTETTTVTTQLVLPTFAGGSVIPIPLALLLQPYYNLKELYTEVSQSPEYKASFLKKPFMKNIKYLSELSSLEDLVTRITGLLQDFDNSYNKIMRLFNEPPTYANVYAIINLAQRARMDYNMLLNVYDELKNRLNNIVTIQPSVECPKNSFVLVEKMLRANSIEEFAKIRAQVKKLGGIDKVVLCIIKESLIRTINVYKNYTNPWLQEELSNIHAKLQKIERAANELIQGA